MIGLFLDRDGVLNLNTHYPHCLEDLFLDPSVGKLFSYLKDKNVRPIILSNQLGVHRNMFTYGEVISFQAAMRQQIFKQSNYWVPENQWYFCINPNSYLRKPNPGMVLRAAEDHNIELDKSLMIGDKGTDIEAAERAGCKHKYLIQSNELLYDVVRKYF